MLLFNKVNMPYRKTNYKRRFYSKDKYSVEQYSFTATLATTQTNNLYQGAVTVVPTSTTQGMRKVKHLTVSLNFNLGSFLYWALVYVPEGYTYNPLNSQGSLYEPNQFVMSSGLLNNNAGPSRITTPLARNLNSGDSIYLINPRTVLPELVDPKIK